MLNVAIENQNGWNYSAPAPHKTGAGRGNPKSFTAHNRAQAVFLCVKHSHIRIMVGRAGQPQGWPGSVMTGISTPVRLTTLMVVENLGGELIKFIAEAAIMATTLTPSHPEFVFVFAAVRRADRHPRICMLRTVAGDERSARRSLVRDYVLSLAARLPVVEVSRA